MRTLALLALLLPGLAHAQDQEERDRGFLTGLIEDNLSSAARQVVIEGFEGALSTRATVVRLTIADAGGVWLEARDLTLDWDRSALLGGRIDVEELSAGSIAVLRAPLGDPAAPTPEATPFSLPDLPVAVLIDALAVERITLGESLLGTEVSLTLSGAVSLEGGEGSAALSADIVAGSEGALDFAASYSNATRVLDLNLDLSEAPDGLVANALGLPGLPSVDLRLAGTAPIDDYAATLSLATDGTPRVSGDFALKTTAAAGPGEVVARAFGVDVEGDVTSLVAPDLAEFFGPDVSLLAKGIRRSNGSFRLSSFDIGTRALSLEGAAEVTAQGWPRELTVAGTLGTGDGPVPLPGASGVVVERAVIDVAYDQAAGDAWTGAFAVTGLERAGVRVPSLSLDGGGVIVPATDAGPGRFTADLAYAALGLAFDDEGLAEALGADIRGRVDLVRGEDGGPLRVRSLTLSGPGVEAMAEGTVAGPAEGFLVRSSVMLEAAALGRFAALTGLDLGGSAAVTLVSAFRPLDGIFDVALTGTTQDLALGIAELDPLLAGAGTITLAAARDERGLRVERLDVATDAVAVEAGADVTSADSRASFALRLSDLGLSVPTLSGPASVTGTVERDSLGLVTLDAVAEGPGLAATISASRPGADGAPATFALSADADDLAPYAPLLARLRPGLAPTGAVEASLSGTAALDGSAFDVAVRAETASLALGVERLDPLLAGEGRLAARAVRTGPGDLMVEGARVETALLTGTASARVSGGEGSAELDLAVAEVAGVLPGLSGPARVAGTAGLTAEAVAVDLDASLPGGTARLDGTVDRATRAFTGEAGVAVADLQPFSGLLGRDLAGGLDAEASGTVGGMGSFDLTLDASATGLRLGVPALDAILAGATEVTGTAARGPEGTDLDLAATLLGGRVAVDGLLAPDAAAFEGEVAADLPDLAPLSPLFGRDVGGALDGTASGRLRTDLTALDLTFEAATRDLRTGVPALDPLLAGPGTVSSRAERGADGLALALVADTPLLDADVSGTFGAEGGSAAFDVGVAEVSSVLPGLSGPASAVGTATQGPDGVVALDLDAVAPGATASVEATLDPARGFEAAGRAEVAVADLAPFSRLAGRPLGGSVEGTVAGTLRPDLSRFDLRVDAATRDLSPSPALAPVLAGAGTVTGRVLRDDAGLRAEGLVARFPNLSVDADVDGATTRFDARLADVALFAPSFSGPVTARGTATVAGGRTEIGVDVQGPGGIAARVDGGVGATADLSATGTAPLALANAFIEPRNLDGTASFDLALRGPLALESVTGTVRLSGARLADPGLGQAVEGIDGTVALAGGTATLDLSGRPLAGGRIAVAGPVRLQAPFVADLRVTGADVAIRDPALYEALAALDLTVRGPLAGGVVVAGAVDLLSVEVRLPSSSVSPLGDLPAVRHLAPPPAVVETLARAEANTAGGERAASGGGGVNLDLLLRAPARVFVRGRGLDAELGGELRLTGATGRILPAGQLGLLRGRIDVLGQRFDLTEGSATLQGDFVPYLRLVAETEARTGTLVRIVLEGPATEPVVSFSSTPELPEDEVLAQLIFGVDLGSITPFQAVQLASAAATLSGRGGGLLDDIRGDSGLADLDLSTDEAGNAALRLGRYVGENAYTDVTVSTEETEATINLDLTPDLTVRAGVTSGGETTLRIEFARDY